MDEGYVEIVLELAPGGDPSFVARWLEQHGLTTQALVVGTLATGTADTVRRAFGTAAGDRPPVPGELRGHVASIAFAPRKDWHGES
jgi:hypothetical protein